MLSLLQRDIDEIARLYFTCPLLQSSDQDSGMSPQGPGLRGTQSYRDQFHTIMLTFPTEPLIQSLSPGSLFHKLEFLSWSFLIPHAQGHLVGLPPNLRGASTCLSCTKNTCQHAKLVPKLQRKQHEFNSSAEPPERNFSFLCVSVGPQSYTAALTVIKQYHSKCPGGQAMLNSMIYIPRAGKEGFCFF